MRSKVFLFTANLLIYSQLLVSCGGGEGEETNTEEIDNSEVIDDTPKTKAYVIRHTMIQEEDAMYNLTPGTEIEYGDLSLGEGVIVTFKDGSGAMKSSDFAKKDELALVTTDSKLFIYPSKESRTTTSTWLTKGNVFKILKDEDGWKQIEIGDNRSNVTVKSGWIYSTSGQDYITNFDQVLIGLKFQGVLTDTRYSNEEKVEALEAVLEEAKGSAKWLADVIEDTKSEFTEYVLEIDLNYDELTGIDGTFGLSGVNEDREGLKIDSKTWKMFLKTLINVKLTTFERESWFADKPNPKTAYLSNIMSHMQHKLPDYNTAGVLFEDIDGQDALDASMFANAVYYVNRDKDHVQKLFDDNKEFVYELLSGDRYASCGMQTLVNRLIDLKDIMNQSGRQKELLDSCSKYFSGLQKRVSQGEENVYSSEYEIFWSFLLKEIYKDANLDPANFKSYEDNIENLDLWLPSFWYRRYAEGNDKVVYKILLEIQEHYKEAQHMSHLNH